MRMHVVCESDYYERQNKWREWKDDIIMMAIIGKDKIWTGAGDDPVAGGQDTHPS